MKVRMLFDPSGALRPGPALATAFAAGIAAAAAFIGFGWWLTPWFVWRFYSVT